MHKFTDGNAGPKVWGICGETAFLDLNRADPIRVEAARMVAGQTGRGRNAPGAGRPRKKP